MTRYTLESLREFLRAIDRHLTTPAEMILVGGTAASLGYGYSGATMDIDTYNSIEHIKGAIEAAVAETGYGISVEQVTVGDIPYFFDERLKNHVDDKLKRLSIKILDPVDLILMKAMRYEQQDKQAIQSLVNSEVISDNIIVDRYIKEMGHITKDQDAADFNIRMLVDDCYGSVKASDAEGRIKKWRAANNQRK
jgi:hypothetical protein